ncbi:molybdopterin adenylyltransferase [Martelella soudanensis]|uniref:molybdopterin adenylyltransferase n=1 Tax=unclassified Martelella TaxID=2629616 RepID=UPI0015E059CA|nr:MULTISPECIES: molybdopterin adenylyltransferase [unclassified Martelella]
MLIVALTVSDRASRGEYEDLSGAMIEGWLKETVTSPYDLRRKIIPDGTASVAGALVDLCDNVHADLILTTGGTGPAPRDQTPEAMQSVLEKELPGFGELMRRVSLEQAPTAILSRQTAGVRGRSLIVNLPGRPASIRLCLNAVFPAIPYCLDLIGAGRIETDSARIKAHRPPA